MSKLFLASFLLFLSSCNQGPSAPPQRTTAAATVKQPPAELGEDKWTQLDSDQADNIRDIFRKMLQESTGNSALMKRDAHPKHHGCVKASLKIDNSLLREEWRQGLFKVNGDYESWVRFSNGDPNHRKADAEGDVRGMAVKIMKVPYKSYLNKIQAEEANPVHDLVMMNSPEFFLDTTEAYLDLMTALYKGPIAMGWYGITHPKVMAILGRARSMKVGNPLDIDYHSATPYKLGPTSMKFKMVSCRAPKDAVPENPAHNFLSERLADSVDEEKGNCFNLLIQPNTHTFRNSVKDPTVPWVSSFIQVGVLNIPKQTLVQDDPTAFCEHIGFNPWRAPEENRPLGAVNRVRLEVYVKQSKMRHDYNQREEIKPTSF